MPSKGVAMDDQRLEILIANLLRAGVLLAAALVLGGGVAYLAHTHASRVSYRVFAPSPDGIRRVPGIVLSAAHFSSQGWMQLGLLLLIATPVARVVMAVVGFAMQRDRLYVVVSLIVLGVLLASLMRAA